MIPLNTLPHLNALLNGASTFFLLLGFWFIRRKRIPQHKFCMLCAVAASLLFLASYLVYHYHAGSKPFQGQGFIRPVYFAILLSHTILAMVNVPLVLITLVRALRERFDQHARLARRWTFPVWLYVSVTGVLVYLMLYQL
ncbi:MAG: DUF420 domain-containing protein [candidate division KSB1 bacterium]|nr:DUF420 domain-containing protein [candidate division KSB1 bacterium]MDZ7274813.1 DUF420 domain-containing protein [candidate division KSB1 bacterium]MDZ7285638.1 DUF420 domain-containing protein [candidate division KSB1 bacterium]MDZ7298670.1 DUF420 domain-containing protein [candidate division KSB1 bacterium]MDZ7308791.1 DUF420 domain-containing protein [candidate division KSB1 bacterium]